MHDTRKKHQAMSKMDSTYLSCSAKDTKSFGGFACLSEVSDQAFSALVQVGLRSRNNKIAPVLWVHLRSLPLEQ